MARIITLTNNYHHTTVNLRPDEDGYLSLHQINRAWRTLCGIKGCTCGDELGTRGRQECDIEIIYDEYCRPAGGRIVNLEHN